MTRFHEDPRLTACALGALGAEEQLQFEETLRGDPAARLELEEISRVAELIERELAGPTGIGLSVQQKLQLEREWQARSASVGAAGAPGDAPDLWAGRAVRRPLLEEFARPESSRRSGRGRFAKALLAAVVLHATAAAALVAFPSTASEIVPELEGVAFAPRASPESPRVSVAIESRPACDPSECGLHFPSRCRTTDRRNRIALCLPRPRARPRATWMEPNWVPPATPCQRHDRRRSNR